MEELKRYAFVFKVSFPGSNFFCFDKDCGDRRSNGYQMSVKRCVKFIIWIVIYMEEIT